MTMERTARRVPEVMVRVTGRQHGGGHVLANFAYISRLGYGSDKELALHTSDGDVVRDGCDMQVLAQDWHEWEMGGGARRQGATSISMILSMPTGTDPEGLQEAVLAFAREEFANRSWVASLHIDRDHPHVHLTFARRDHDGRRFHPDRDDLFRYRQRFAEKLRDCGIEANATPARARGIDPAHEPIAARKVREKGEVPRIDTSRAERLRGRGVADPVQAFLADRQAAVWTAYERSIAELSSFPEFVDRVIARNLEKFVGSMPAPEPNSARAVGRRAHVQDEAVRPTAPVGRDASTAGRVPERPSGISDRLRSLMEEASKQSADAANQRPPEIPDRLPAENVLDRPSGISDRLRSLMEVANKQSAAPTPTRADEVLRQTQERDREQPERDRARDRDGPRR